MSKRTGFTLVELLIVIVVLAILATITVVAYNNIQERAYSAKVIATVEAYAQALRMYHIENGRFPVSGVNASCLGRVSDYPAEDGFAAGACVKDSNGSTANVADDNFADELESYMKTKLPDPTIRPARETFPPSAWNPSGTWTEYRGIYYEQWTSGSTDNAFMEYAIRGQVACPKAYTTRYKAESNITYCNQRIRLQS